jgi:hypothetical protein
MKEEQNASSSANYDVEIFHPVAAHAGILKLKVILYYFGCSVTQQVLTTIWTLERKCSISHERGIWLQDSHS